MWVRFEAAAEHHPCSRVEDGNDVASGSEGMNNEAGKNTPPIPIRPTLKVEETNDYY